MIRRTRLAVTIVLALVTIVLVLALFSAFRAQAIEQAQQEAEASGGRDW